MVPQNERSAPSYARSMAEHEYSENVRQLVTAPLQAVVAELDRKAAFFALRHNDPIARALVRRLERTAAALRCEMHAAQAWPLMLTPSGN